MIKDIKSINEAFLQYCFNHYKCKTISELSRATGWALETISRVRNGKRDVPFKWELDSDYSIIEVLGGNTIKDCKDIYGKWSSGVTYQEKRYNTKSFNTYSAIVSRCTKSFQKISPHYEGVTTSFTSFDQFADWSYTQIGSDILDYDIDKDLLKRGNRVYSPENCVYLPSYINRSISLRQESRSNLPRGVVPRVQLGKEVYVASIRVGKKLKYLGTFNNPEDAHTQYKIAYNERIMSFLQDINSGLIVVDNRVGPALEKYLLK